MIKFKMMVITKSDLSQWVNCECSSPVTNSKAHDLCRECQRDSDYTVLTDLLLYALQNHFYSSSLQSVKVRSLFLSKYMDRFYKYEPHLLKNNYASVTVGNHHWLMKNVYSPTSGEWFLVATGWNWSQRQCCNKNFLVVTLFASR